MYKADEAEPDRVENLKEFVSAVNLSERTTPGNHRRFLRMVALISDADEIDDSNSVTLATIHAVKGLEFPVVFIVALEENIFPSSHAVIESDDNIEEERRLMYVAITRAKERLYVSSSRCRFRFNQRQNNLRSRFVQELIGNVPAKRRKRRSPSKINVQARIHGRGCRKTRKSRGKRRGRFGVHSRAQGGTQQVRHGRNRVGVGQRKRNHRRYRI